MGQQQGDEGGWSNIPKGRKGGQRKPKPGGGYKYRYKRPGGKSAPKAEESKAPSHSGHNDTAFRSQLAKYKLDIYGRSQERAEWVAKKIEAGISEEENKDLDLCNTDPQYCEDNLGIERSSMPQVMDTSVKKLLASSDPKDVLKGKAAVAAGADPKADKPIMELMLESMRSAGVEVKDGKKRAEILKATQREIKAGKAYGMADSYFKGTFDPAADVKIVISSDGHILDGHHRWASLLIADPKREMQVIQVDLPMREFLKKAHAFPGVFRADLQDRVVPKDAPLDLQEDVGKSYREWYGKQTLMKGQPAAIAAPAAIHVYSEIEAEQRAGNMDIIDRLLGADTDLQKASASRGGIHRDAKYYRRIARGDGKQGYRYFDTKEQYERHTGKHDGDGDAETVERVVGWRARTPSLNAPSKLHLTPGAEDGGEANNGGWAGTAPIGKSETSMDAIDLLLGADPDLRKAEGSRGGHVIGHTNSGKPIYASSGGDHGAHAASHKDFGPKDHADAAELHRKKREGSKTKQDWDRHNAMHHAHTSQEAATKQGPRRPAPSGKGGDVLSRVFGTTKKSETRERTRKSEAPMDAIDLLLGADLDLQKAGGWSNIPGGKHGGERKRDSHGGWEYRYPDHESAHKAIRHHREMGRKTLGLDDPMNHFEAAEAAQHAAARGRGGLPVTSHSHERSKWKLRGKPLHQGRILKGGGGWSPIPKGRKGGERRRKASGGYEYRYKKPAKKAPKKSRESKAAVQLQAAWDLASASLVAGGYGRSEENEEHKTQWVAVKREIQATRGPKIVHPAMTEQERAALTDQVAADAGSRDLVPASLVSGERPIVKPLPKVGSTIQVRGDLGGGLISIKLTAARSELHRHDQRRERDGVTVRVTEEFDHFEGTVTANSSFDRRYKVGDAADDFMTTRGYWLPAAKEAPKKEPAGGKHRPKMTDDDWDGVTDDLPNLLIEAGLDPKLHPDDVKTVWSMLQHPEFEKEANKFAKDFKAKFGHSPQLPRGSAGGYRANKSEEPVNDHRDPLDILKGASLDPWGDVLQKAGGWSPIPGGKKGGFRRRGPGGKWEYNYDAPGGSASGRQEAQAKRQSARGEQAKKVAAESQARADRPAGRTLDGKPVKASPRFATQKEYDAHAASHTGFHNKNHDTAARIHGDLARQAREQGDTGKWQHHNRASAAHTKAAYSAPHWTQASPGASRGRTVVTQKSEAAMNERSPLDILKGASLDPWGDGLQKAGGWSPIPKGRKGGERRRKASGGYEYRYKKEAPRKVKAEAEAVDWERTKGAYTARIPGGSLHVTKQYVAILGAMGRDGEGWVVSRRSDRGGHEWLDQTFAGIGWVSRGNSEWGFKTAKSAKVMAEKRAGEWPKTKKSEEPMNDYRDPLDILKGAAPQAPTTHRIGCVTHHVNDLAKSTVGLGLPDMLDGRAGVEMVDVKPDPPQRQIGMAPRLRLTSIVSSK